jgi:hypothetical protein
MLQLLFCLFLFPSPAANTKTNNSVQQSNISATYQFDTLHILISKENKIFYYNGRLQQDASNFKTGTATSVKDWVKFSSDESKQRHHQLLIILKIQSTPALNENSKQFVEFIKKQLNYKQAKLSEVEKELIRITEEVMK